MSILKPLGLEDLHEYQLRGVEFIKERTRVALLIEMGLGKTAIVLTALADMFDSMLCRRVLIVAPLRVANTVWKQEAARWTHTKHLKVVVCTGKNPKARLMKLMQDADIYVINVDVLPWLVHTYIDRWQWDTLIIDESSMFKNPDTQRFREIKKVRRKFDYIVELTGTPTPNSMLEIWPQIFLLDGGNRLGKSFGAFKQMFFEPADFYGYKYAIKRGALPVIQGRMQDITMSLQAKDYLELPERLDVNVEVELPEEVAGMYKKLFEDSLLELEGDNEVTALNAAVLAGKLMQICNGAIYVNQTQDWKELHKVKLDALEEIIEENYGENLLIAYSYKHDLARLQARFGKRGAIPIGRNEEVVAAWNRGDIPLLLAHPMSAGHGLNLQFGGSTIVWFSMTWSLEQYLQFNARVHRQGQGKPVRIIHIIAKDTIDGQIMEILNRKNADQRMLLECFKV
jgi:SNF2 family DNA or RNA helicase